MGDERDGLSYDDITADFKGFDGNRKRKTKETGLMSGDCIF